MTRLLVNFFYAHNVGHAIEALHYANGYHAADPALEIGVALNAATPVELASAAPFVAHAYAVDHPMLEPCPDSDARLEVLPPDWDWVIDDARRYQAFQLDAFPGMRDYYAAADRRLNAALGRRPTGWPPPAYTPHAGLRLVLPEPARLAGEGPAIALMPTGSADRAMYPSLASWTLVLDALADAIPGLRIVLIGRMARDERTSSSFGPAEHAALLAHRTRPIDGFDRPLLEQLALVEACDVFLSTHTGFGLAALAVGTPWLTLSGGRWFEYYFNRVPFRSILPDVERYPSFSQFQEPAVVEEEDGPRTPSMTRARVEDDLDRIVAGARELIAGSLGYERALREYFDALLAAHGGDASAIWSIDGVADEYLARG